MPPLSVRNLFYLRVSASLIVATVLYLDQRHVAWMNAHPEVLEHVVRRVLRLKYVTRHSRRLRSLLEETDRRGAAARRVEEHGT